MKKKEKYDKLFNEMANSSDSPFWTRVLGNIPPGSNGETCMSVLDKVLDVFKVGSIIIGHTPQFYQNKLGINSACDDKL